jgi:hypothetical protein
MATAQPLLKDGGIHDDNNLDCDYDESNYNDYSRKTAEMTTSMLGMYMMMMMTTMIVIIVVIMIQ